MSRSDVPTPDDLDIDPVLEARIRDTLRAVAATTPVPEEVGEADGTVLVGLHRPEPAPARRALTSTTRRVLAVAAALALAVAAVAVLRGGSDDPSATLPAAGTGEVLPAGFDLATATPVFSAPGSPPEVAAAYLADRFPDREPLVDPDIEVVGGAATVGWTQPGDGAADPTSPEPAASGHRGDVHLRRFEGSWAVVASTTHGLDLSTLSYDGERVRGAAMTEADDSLFADVLTPAGEPVRRAPRPEGFSEKAEFRFGTAAGPATGTLGIDVEHRRAPAVVRVTLVGGTMLSIAELRFDPPALPAHQDYEACVQQHPSVDKEPAPDEVERQCADALQGKVLASGSAGHRRWEVVASSEPRAFVTVRGTDIVRVMRLTGPGPRTVEELGADLFLIGDHTGMAVVLPAGSEAVRLRTATEWVDAESFTDPRTGLTIAILILPPAAPEELGTLEVRRNGTYRVVAEGVGLAARGG